MKRDWCAELDKLLAEAGAEVTFSPDCRSGYVGRERCGCTRCAIWRSRR